jgi:hypothetical protein
MREWLQSVLDRARERLRRGSDWPRYVVRVGPRAAEAWRIVYSAIEDGPPWSDDLIERRASRALQETIRRGAACCALIGCRAIPFGPNL